VQKHLMNTLLDLVNDEKKIHELEANILKTGNANADETIANEILKTIKK
jgi:hypothetical protein